MSFVDGFYSFFIEIINTEAGLYESVRVKTPKHPEESLTHLAARALAYAHAYQDNIEFTEGVYKPDLPTLQVPDGIGGLQQWIDVGCSPMKKVKRALQEFPNASIAVYFYDQEHVDSACHMLRGTKKNWIAPVTFYLIEPEPLERVAEALLLRNKWTVTFIDTSFFLQTESIDCSGTIIHQDMWHAYQASIGNAQTPPPNR
jgi:uncharacterized protein YaeQ